MKKEFKLAFEEYYKNLENIHKITFETLPTVCVNLDDIEIDKDLICSEEDDDGYVVWKLKEIDEFDFSEIEKEIGFKLSNELKAYFSTYMFLHLAGECDGIKFSFDALKSKEYIQKKILISKKDGDYYFENEKLFVLGSATYKNDDAYVIFYDNKTEKVFIYENDTNNKIETNKSLLDIIKNMKADF